MSKQRNLPSIPLVVEFESRLSSDSRPTRGGAAAAAAAAEDAALKDSCKTYPPLKDKEVWLHRVFVFLNSLSTLCY